MSDQDKRLAGEYERWMAEHEIETTIQRMEKNVKRGRIWVEDLEKQHASDNSGNWTEPERQEHEGQGE